MSKKSFFAVVLTLRLSRRKRKKILGMTKRQFLIAQQRLDFLK